MFASTAFGQLRYIKETVAGVTPIAGVGVNLRTTGPDMKAAMQSVTSNEISFQRMVRSLVNVDMSVDGGFGFELSAKEYDPFIEGVLCNSWVHYGTNGISATTPVTTTATTIVAGTATTGADAFTGLGKGQWFRVVPGAAASNVVKEYFATRWLKVSEAVSPTSTTITLDASTPLSGAGLLSVSTDVKISSSRVINGAQRSSFTLEWAQTDITQFLQYRGMRPNTMSLKFEVGSFLSGTFGFFGETHGITQASTLPGGPSFTPSQSGDGMNSVSNMGILAVDGVDLLAGGSSFISSVSLDISNNLRGQKAIGVFGNAGVGYGEFAVSGTMECYFENEALYERAMNNDRLSIALGVTDSVGNGYLFEMPKILFKDASVNYGNKDSDVMLSLPIQALLDDAKGYGLSVTRAVVA